MALLRFTTPRPLTPEEATRSALHILEKPIPAVSIGDNRIVQAVKKIAPAVVSIDTIGKSRVEDASGAPLYINQEVRGKGSGVVFTPDGYILTNNHVIDGANRIRVTTAQGQWRYARLIGRDPGTDLAVLKVDGSGLPTAEFGNSDGLQVGEWSIAVGNPLGLGSTVTVGVISALNRHNLQVDEGRNLEGAIQTDAAINRGNSGGALANINGQLIGINTAILSSGPNGGSIGLGFAIPINTVRRIARDLIADGGKALATRPLWLGLELGIIPENISQQLHLAPYRGVYVIQVEPDSPAHLAGLLDGDILLDMDDKPVNNVNDVHDILQRHRRGDALRLRLLRPDEGQQRTVRVVLQERPESVFLAP